MITGPEKYRDMRTAFYKITGLSPLSAIPLFIIPMTAVVMISDLVFYVIFIFILVAVSLMAGLPGLILTPLKLFRFFIIISFIVTYISTGEPGAALTISLKMIILLTLSYWFNVFTDIKALLHTPENIRKDRQRSAISALFKKPLTALILAVSFIEDLFTEGRRIRDIHIADNGSKGIVKRISGNSEILRELFYYCFRKAQEMEKNFTADDLN